MNEPDDAGQIAGCIPRVALFRCAGGQGGHSHRSNYWQGRTRAGSAHSRRRLPHGKEPLQHYLAVVLND